MKRTTIMALMEGHKKRLNEGLIFFKATNDIDRAGDEYTTTEYHNQEHKFYEGVLRFDIPAGVNMQPLREFYKGNEIVIGFSIQTTEKVFVDEITDYDVQRVVRGLIAKEVASYCGKYVGNYSIDCKLTKLYLSGAIEWDEYVNVIIENC